MTPDETIEQLAAWFEDRFAQLRSLADTLTSILNLDADGMLVLSSTARREMKSAASDFLQQHLVVDGCGLIFAHSSLGTKSGRLEWWVREDESRFARYSFGVVPGGDRYYNYEQHEWFIRAFEEGRSAAVGPFIDYLGVEVYIMTLTVPAVVEGQRVGAVGNDLQIDDLERALLPMLQQCETDLVVLSRHGNVLVSNTAEFLPGELVSDPRPGYRFVALPDVTDGIRVMVAG
ncbi:cache domain-containing protein [Leucobacter denitrificans]|uniref:Cache domain-containing protein n=1 Tax=Leucobacter denitrificans TaxID=683042 RepID=A0A7G9S2G3_9MICO|nr:cache domain-containing protein [Leucobacter denitrificans]QNN62038.1 hypothetical protein H9L06_06875 [Leucobacter denitrificans]